VIPREAHLHRLAELLELFPVVGIIGARQVGKTTLARQYAGARPQPVRHLDLESPRDLAMLDDPLLALEGEKDLGIMNEVQRRPDLFEVLRVLVDRPGTPCRFLVLGSASPDLLRQGSESLAGRITYHELPGFSIREVGIEALDRLWIRGGFPLGHVAPSDPASLLWRQSFIQTFLERDLPQLGFRLPSETLRRFWTMLAHYHGQVLNASELGRALGVAHTTIRGYLDALASGLVVRLLPPWFENLKKRQVKSPKVYVRDSGILHALLGLGSGDDLAGHPKVGASWEGFALEQVIQRLGARPEQCHFWGTYSSAIESLGLDRLDVLHPGRETFRLASNVRAIGIRRLEEDIEPLVS
jgi:predicted AAA+ superfamily ATPase